MFFTRLGTILAWCALIFGGLRLATGIYVALNLDTPDFDPARYLGSRTSGEAIDQAVAVIAAAVALGVLVEISRSLNR